MGIAEQRDGTVGYAVFIDSLQESISLKESELETTGVQRRREDYYKGDSIRVNERGELLEE